MKRKQYVVLGVFAAFVLSAVVVWGTDTKKEEAWKGDTWEYLALSDFEVAEVQNIEELIGKIEEFESKSSTDHKALHGTVKQSGTTVVMSSRKVIQAGLNKLGDRGWELVAINGGVYYFKRPKQK
ncbi:MAG: hypothetical protein PVH19_01240 [Planctomycetia bacterium]|jgi:hypothetical protein